MIVGKLLGEKNPDVHRGWLEAELDAQLFLIDLNNASEVAKMADDQTEGMPRKTLWFSLYGQNPPEIGGGEDKNVFDFVFNEKAMTLVKAATIFLHGRKVVPNAVLRSESVWDQVARDVLKARGLSSPIGSVKEQPDSAYKE